MVITKAKLQRLEQKIKSQLLNNSLKPVPENWEDFVRLTTIRSGGQMLRFDPYEYQKILSRLMDLHNNIVVVKSRQLGTTQGIISKFLHDACLNAASSSVCFMRNGDDVGSLSRRLKQMLEGLNEYVQRENDAVGYVKIRNLGDIYIKNSSKEGIRSLDSVTNQLYDESAFIPNIDQIYAASSPSSALVGDKIKKIIVSTPSAKSGWYWDKLTSDNGDVDVEEVCKAVAARELYKEIPGIYYWSDQAGVLKLVLHWTCHPVYSQRSDYLEYRQKQDGTDWETIQREYNLAFIDSSVSVFSSEIVRACAIGDYEDDYDPDADYYAGLDTATTGNDYLTMPILKYKFNKLSLVHLYRKRHETNQYHLYQIGKVLDKYKVKKVGIEITGGVGQLYLEQLTNQFKHIEFEAIRTTGDSKPVMITNLQLALEKELLDYPVKCPLVEELLSFRREGNKLEAAPGKHDDTVMGTAFAIAVSPLKLDSKRGIFSDVSTNW